MTLIQLTKKARDNGHKTVSFSFDADNQITATIDGKSATSATADAAVDAAFAAHDAEIDAKIAALDIERAALEAKKAARKA